MNEAKHDDNAHGGPNTGNIHQVHRPYWKRAHHDWRFWVAACFIFGAMIIYVLSVEFTVRPGNELPVTTLSGNVAK